MAVGAGFLEYVLEQLAKLGGLRKRRMFGAVGLYCDDRFFAVIDDDTLFFKVDDATRGDYLSRGMKPFMPYKDKPDVSMSYFTVPAGVIDDAEELVVWARKSVAAAERKALSAPKARKPSLARKRKTPARRKGPAKRRS